MINLWNTIRGLFRPAPPTLRNKPGGMAWIKHYDAFGQRALAGRVVTTVRLTEKGFWLIEPPQSFVVTENVKIMDTGQIFLKGDNPTVVAIVDDLLEPIRDVGEGERDESAAWLPPVPSDAVWAPKRQVENT